MMKIVLFVLVIVSVSTAAVIEERQKRSAESQTAAIMRIFTACRPYCSVNTNTKALHSCDSFIQTGVCSFCQLRVCSLMNLAKVFE
uniref:Uncharacterized protein n=1 Tax=Ciona intestinalis TaxID=7719 RepID=H2XKL4_CIOIN